MLDIQVEGSENLRRMARALRKADTGGGMKRSLGRAMHRAAGPMKRAVQDAAENIETHGFRKPGAKHPFEKVMTPKGTRHKIAEAVQVEARINEDNPKLSIRVAGARLPADLKNMPQHFDSGRKWRHPTLGNRNAWTSQIGKPWFEQAAEDHIEVVVRECDKAIDETRQELERA